MPHDLFFTWPAPSHTTAPGYAAIRESGHKVTGFATALIWQNVRPQLRRGQLRGQKRDLLREPDAGNPPVRFDEREVETGHGRDSEAPVNERAGYR